MPKRSVPVLVLALIVAAVIPILAMATTPAAGARSAATGGFDFTRAQVSVTGLQVPWALAFLPDGSGLVSERNTGRIMQVRPGAAPVAVATLPGVSASGESGLLGIAVSPTYAQDQWVYAYYTTASDNRVVRFRLNAAQSPQVLLSGIPSAAIHDGGRIAFGPDGMLYVATGDAAATGNAQNLSSLAGKILRLRPDGTIPPDNPFAGSAVYSYGHRNVQGLAWDSQGRLYATEFGQNTWDEINAIVAGGNYGWPTCEGTCSNASFRNPIVTWTTAEASPSGLAYANGTLFAAGLRGNRLWTVPVTASGSAGTPVAELQGRYGRLRAVAVGPDGWLWITTSNRDGRGTPTADDDRIIRVPPDGGGTASPTVTRTVTPTVTSTVTPTTSPTAGGCTAAYRVTGQWSGGFQGELTVRNSGTAPITGWTVTFAFPNGQTISQMWGGRHTQSGASVTVRNETWNGSLGPGAGTAAGFLASWNGNNGVPSPVTCTAS
ncbi:glucose/arabinose dehydrogenase [Thermocatellispora tengchongensis]|uniref:Glucose/arabinose dehydrogenase n=1 Tax=Thermocatellispora tengchongensis TaxID=1073253 RepID=A0A840NUE6_9ACTN|nr:PQQ-dependent sugar dehydrogenase [Thermocatellispora tengchongensis]MBB5132364.1 glucose/arabinose dehydrogenase [Thermocatellispora tengchongensis]